MLRGEFSLRLGCKGFDGIKVGSVASGVTGAEYKHSIIYNLSDGDG